MRGTQLFLGAHHLHLIHWWDRDISFLPRKHVLSCMCLQYDDFKACMPGLTLTGTCIPCSDIFMYFEIRRRVWVGIHPPPCPTPLITAQRLMRCPTPMVHCVAWLFRRGSSCGLLQTGGSVDLRIACASPRR